MPFKFASFALSPADPQIVQSKKHIKKLQKMAPFPRYTVHTQDPKLLFLDWIESPQALIFKIEAPGYRKNEIKVQVEEGRVLVIKAECKEENQAKFGNLGWHLAKSGGNGTGYFSRELELPEDVKVNQIKASMENGVLSVVVPKVSSPKPSILKNVPISSKL